MACFVKMEELYQASLKVIWSKKRLFGRKWWKVRWSDKKIFAKFWTWLNWAAFSVILFFYIQTVPRKKFEPNQTETTLRITELNKVNLPLSVGNSGMSSVARLRLFCILLSTLSREKKSSNSGLDLWVIYHLIDNNCWQIPKINKKYLIFHVQDLLSYWFSAYDTDNAYRWGWL